MRPLRVDVQAVLFASLGLVTLLGVCCTLYDPRLLAVRSFLAPYKERFLSQVRSKATFCVLCRCCQDVLEVIGAS